LLVAIFLHLVSLFFGLKTFIEDTFQLGIDLELLQIGLGALSCLRIAAVSEHLDEQFGEHLEHLALNMHVIVKVVVTLLTELDFA